jgi:branched-chain amino acid transport system substrate-binding protein
MIKDKTVNRRQFNRALAAVGASAALAPFGIVRAKSSKLRVGVLLPRSGVQALIGQSCQRAAEIAPGLIREMLGVDVEIMSGDTESNVDVARTRAERLIQEGAHILVGAFDSGQTVAIAQVAEQRGVPLVVNIAAAPQITNQGYKFVSRIFITAPEIVTQGLSLMGDLFQATNTAPRTTVFMHVNDTFGQAVAKAVGAILPRLTHLPFRILETIPYDVAARDLSVEVARAKSSKPDFLMLICRLNDAIILRREMVRQRWYPMGVIGPGSPGMYEEQFAKSLGKVADYCVTNNPWYNPKAELAKVVERAFLKRYPKDRFVYHGLNVGYTFEGILVAADAFRRAKSTDPTTLAQAVRQTDIGNRVMLGGPIKFNEKGQVEGNLMAGVQIRDGVPRVILPANAAEAKPVFPAPDYKPA